MMRRAILKGLIALGLLGLFPGRRLRAHSGTPRKRRPCDGACCHEAPLRSTNITLSSDPPQIEKECVFHDHTMQFDINSGCRLMADAGLLDGLSTDELRRFAVGCLGYPFLYRAPKDQPGRCCYDWHAAE